MSLHVFAASQLLHNVKDCKAKPAKLEKQQLGRIGKHSQSQSVGVFGSAGDGLRILSVASRVNSCLFFFSDITWAACSISSSMKTHLTGVDRNIRNHITRIEPKAPL